MSDQWKEYWSRENKIYVSPRHLKANYDTIASDTLALLPHDTPLTLLDWGCGDALSAPLIAAAGHTVLLHDSVDAVETRVRARFAGTPNVRVLGASELASLPSGSVDVILIHSVLQYVGKEEFAALLPGFHRLLAPGGLLLLGDIVPPDLGMAVDVLDLLAAGLRHGFLVEALLGMLHTLFSDYRTVRRTAGFTTYEEEELLALLAAAGFRAERVPRNIGLCAHRMLIRAVRV